MVTLRWYSVFYTGKLIKSWCIFLFFFLNVSTVRFLCWPLEVWWHIVALRGAFSNTISITAATSTHSYRMSHVSITCNDLLPVPGDWRRFAVGGRHQKRLSDYYDKNHINSKLSYNYSKMRLVHVFLRHSVSIISLTVSITMWGH